MKIVKVIAGKGGGGGPLIISPTLEKNKIVYVSGGYVPDVALRLAEMTGAELVDGFKNTIPDSEICAFVIDCGGTLRCEIYPKKKIPTINIVSAWKSSLNGAYYASAVTIDNLSFADTCEYAPEKIEIFDITKKISDQRIAGRSAGVGQKIGMIIGVILQTGREVVQKAIDTWIPFMLMTATLIGIILKSGIGDVVANSLTIFAGNIGGLLVLSLITSLPFVSPFLGPGAVIAQTIGVLIGSLIGDGSIPPQLALPALFAINSQASADFIPTGLGLAESHTDTVTVGVPAVLLGRFLTGMPTVLLAYAASFFLTY
ncbi:MAG: PTS glucitol/sorbitol transporter subunit IIB [Brevinema sp.]